MNKFQAHRSMGSALATEVGVERSGALEIGRRLLTTNDSTYTPFQEQWLAARDDIESNRDEIMRRLKAHMWVFCLFSYI